MEVLALGFMAAIVGVIRGALSLILEHPLDVIKTWWQADPQQNSFKRVVKEIYLEKGLLGFYTGAIPNLIRISSKQAYRYPMMLFIPCFYALIIHSVAIVSILTGLTIALLEVVVITPLERMKVWMITSKSQKNPIIGFFKSKPAIYRGTSIVTCRQIVTWVSFLLVQDQLILWSVQMTGNQDLDLTTVFFISLVGGSINTLCVLPFDCIKTNLQKFNNGKSAYQVIRNIYHTSGVLGFYAGWMPRMMQYMINGMVTVSILEKLRRSF